MKEVLYVDDSDFNLSLIELIMTDYPHKVITAPSGAAAMELIENRKIDLVLCDIRLPDFSGFEILEHAKITSNRFTPFVAFTADISASKALKIANAGFTTLLHKPFDHPVFDIIVSTLLIDNSETLDLSLYSVNERMREEGIRILTGELTEFIKNLNLALLNKNKIAISNLFHKIKFALGSIKAIQTIKIIDAISTLGEFEIQQNSKELLEIKRNTLHILDKLTVHSGS